MISFITAVTFKNNAELLSTGNGVRLIADMEINVSSAIVYSNAISLFNLSYFNPLAEGASSIPFLNITSGEIPASLCYQESANASTACGGLNTGLYSNSSEGEIGLIYINYSKPSNASAAIWQVKHGNLSTYNISIPSDCFSQNKISLRFLSSQDYSFPSYSLSYGQCYNGTWKNITSIVTSVMCAGGSGPNRLRLAYDGNWTTETSYDPGTPDWGFDSLGCDDAPNIYEEAIIWNMSAITYTSYFPYVSAGSSDKSYKVIINDIAENFNKTNVTLIANCSNGPSEGDGIIPVNISYYSSTNTYQSNYTINDYLWNPATNLITINISGIEKWFIFESARYDNILIIAEDVNYPLISYGAGTPNNGANLSQNSIYLNTTWTEDRIKNITFKVNNSKIQTYTTATYAYNFTSLANGIYYANVTICDYGNRCNTTSTYRITLDTTNPSATLGTPANNSYLNNATQNLTTSITDNLGAKNATLYIDGIINSTINFGNNFISGTVGIVVSLADGVYKWFYKIFDWAGNSYSTQNNTFTIDTINPSISITFPLNTTYNVPPTTLNFTRSDINLANCWYSTNNGVSNISNNLCNNITGLTAAQGSNIWLAGANDSANNRNASYITFFVDSINPTINFTNPTDISTTYLNRNNIIMNVTSTDTNLVNITINLYNSTRNLINSTTTLTSPNYINYTELADGIYYFNATAIDILNNKNSTETRTLTIDKTNPLISYGTNSEIDGNNVSRNNIYVNISLTEINFANITYTLKNLTATVNTTTYTIPTYSINWTNLPNTDYTYWVNITDLANNRNSTNIRSIRLDTTNPTALLNTPANNTHLNQSSNNFTVNLTDNLGMKNATLNIYNSSGIVNQTTINFAPSTIATTVGIVVNLIDNAYTWFWRLFDWAGNSAVSQNFTAYVDINNLSLCHPIQSSGVYYLDQNIIATGNCFDIQASNVLFDCNSFWIKGPASGTNYGISTNGYNNITVRNCNITNFAYEIKLTNSQNSTIKNVNSKWNSLTNLYGIYLERTTNTNLINVTITNNTATNFYGIFQNSSNSTKIYNSTVYSNTGISEYAAYGSDALGSDYNTYIKNSLIYGVSESGYNLFIEDSNIDGVEVTHVSAVASRNNTILNTTTSTNWWAVGSSTTIYKKWYFNVNVNKSNGDTNRESFVQVYDKDGIIQFAGYTTPAAGVLSDNLILIEQLANETAHPFMTPHTINISYAGFYTNTTLVNLTKVNNSILYVTLQALDSSAPVVTIVYPTATNYSNISTMNYTATDTNLQMCWYSTNNGQVNSTVTCGNNITGLTPSQGSNTWGVWANDTNGNIGAASITFTFDSINPNATLLTPRNGTITNVQSQNLTVNLSDNLGLLNYTLTIYNQSGVYNQTNGIVSGLQTTVGIVVNLIEGVYNWFYRVFDVVGNSFTSSNNTITIDTTAPTIAFTYPLNGYNYTSVTEINYTSNGAYCWYSKSGGLGNQTAVPCGTNFTGASAVDGIRTWTLYVNDSAGNQNSTSVTFRKDSTAPIITIISPTTISYPTTSIDLNYTIFEAGIGIDSCWYKNDTDSNNITLPNCANITFSNSPGTHTVYVWANDSLNNVGSASVYYSISTPAPLFNGGNGTSIDPYQIANWIQLNNTKTNLTAYYILVKDLSSATSDYAGLGDSWIAIGDDSGTFDGKFNGRGYTISNLYVPSTGSYAGLFGYVSSLGEISNLNVNTVNLASSQYSGSIVGKLEGNMYNCSSTLSGVATASSAVGGLIGYSNYGNINNISSIIYGNLSANYAGGLIGYQASSSLQNSNSQIYGYLYGSEYAGGLVGYSISSIDNSYSIVNSTASLIGNSGSALLTHNYPGPTVTNSYVQINDPRFGNIKFLDWDISVSNSRNIISYTHIRNNSAYVNSTQSGMNKSANITFTGIRTNFTNPQIYRDGVICNSTTSPRCYNFTSLNAGTVVFNVSSWSNYSIGDTFDLTPPTIIINTPINTVYSTRDIVLNITSSETLSSLEYSLNYGVTNSSFTNLNTYTFNSGANHLIVYGKDLSGNLGTASVDFTVTYTNLLNLNIVTNPTTVEMGSNFTLIAQTITDNTQINECNFSLSGPSGIIYNNVKGSGIGGYVNWSSAYYFVNQSGDYTYNATCINEYGAKNTTLGSFTVTPYLLSILTPDNPFAIVIETKTEMINKTFQLYDNVNSTMNYTVTVQIQNSSYFTINYPNFSLNGADSSSLPKTFYITFQADGATPEGLYYGNITLYNVQLNQQAVIPFTFGVNPPAAKPKLFDTTQIPCVGTPGGACHINQGGLAQGSVQPYRYYMAKMGDYPVASNCSIVFSSELIQPWITSSVSSNFELKDNMLDYPLTITIAPTISTAPGTYRGLISIHCNQTTALGYASDSDNQIRADITVNPAGNTPTEGGGSNINITNLTQQITEGICGNRICENGLNGTNNFNENYQSCPRDCPGNLSPLTDCFNGGDNCILKSGTALLWIGGFILLILLITTFLEIRKKSKGQRISYLPTINAKSRRR